MIATRRPAALNRPASAGPAWPAPMMIASSRRAPSAGPRGSKPVDMKVSALWPRGDTGNRVGTAR